MLLIHHLHNLPLRLLIASDLPGKESWEMEFDMFLFVFVAVVNQRYEPEVQSPGGFLNNNVVFRCSVPSFVKEHVSVTSWLQKPAFYIYPSTMSGKYVLICLGLF